ncbi:polyadenylate-binding protein-interacting protein 6 [Nymphaea colorata]|nr:polyadenylate-binding protein-interacting protein 6 [Nymphaea colorata]XP_031473581.1 polyadenylate-binding protein-interacting protein 6 [Nymphaea colorata]XP_049931627.1 polyadenylate-binding protein-interacting protein 6 [Nymphaea colorata]XP_049931628.1 polyadenylate-binding protein-interacting protein 6 [Nymphaea colorata]
MLRKPNAMESKKSQLNPNAPVFIPRSQQASQEKGGTHEGIPADSKVLGSTCGQPSGAPFAPNELSDIEPFGSEEFSEVAHEFFGLTEDPFPAENIEQQSNRMGDDNSAMRSLAVKFPGYSEESILDVYAANDGDMEATIEMLAQLETFGTVDSLPDTLGIGDTSTTWPPDDRIPSSSSDPGSSSGY